MKETALEWFSEKISKHGCSRTVDNVDVFGDDAVLHEKIANVYVAGFLAGGRAPVAFEKHGTLIVLMENVVGECVTLGTEKHTGPNGGGEEIASANDFSFGGAFRI